MEVIEQAQRRLRMSWEAYLDFEVEGKAEWVDGEVVVSPAASAGHGACGAQLVAALVRGLPGLSVLMEAGVLLPRNRLRVPDVMVVSGLPDTTFVGVAPVLVVEVLSPSTRAEDLLRKGPEYAAAGVGQYWVVDPQARSIDIYTNVEGAWAPLLHLDDDRPAAEVTVAEHGVVPLELGEVLPR